MIPRLRQPQSSVDANGGFVSEAGTVVLGLIGAVEIRKGKITQIVDKSHYLC